MNRKGFTLIEIIISITLIVLIGASSVFIVMHNKNVETDKKLEALKNEGLIDDNIIDPNTKEKIDYKNNYYVIADAVLLAEGESPTENTCDNTVKIEAFKSWELKNSEYESFYICPKDYSGLKADVEGLKDAVSDLQTRVDKLEGGTSFTPLLQDGYIAKGSNPNNWVIFDVNHDSSKVTTFGTGADQDLWRILSYDGGVLKLVYHDFATTKNSLLYKGTGKTCVKTNSSITHYKNLDPNKPDDLYRYLNDTDWSYFELLEEEKYENKKETLAAQIVNKNYIEKTNYYYDYDTSNKITTSNPRKQTLGTLSVADVNSTKSGATSWIPTPFISGWRYGDGWSSSYKYIVIISATNYSVDNNGKITDTDYVWKDSWVKGTYEASCGAFHYGGSNYLPVVTLKDKVKLVKNDSCATGATQGSKSCPFKLSCDNF